MSAGLSLLSCMYGGEPNDNLNSLHYTSYYHLTTSSNCAVSHTWTSSAHQECRKVSYFPSTSKSIAVENPYAHHSWANRGGGGSCALANVCLLLRVHLLLLITFWMLCGVSAMFQVVGHVAAYCAHAISMVWSVSWRVRIVTLLTVRMWHLTLTWLVWQTMRLILHLTYLSRMMIS